MSFWQGIIRGLSPLHARLRSFIAMGDIPIFRRLRDGHSPRVPTLLVMSALGGGWC